GAELVDRFGSLPVEVEHLLQIVAIKSLCRQANVEKIESGPKGAVVSFRDNTFANPDRLVAFIRNLGPAPRVRPDMKVVFFDDWEVPSARPRGAAPTWRVWGELAHPARAGCPRVECRLENAANRGACTRSTWRRATTHH